MLVDVSTARYKQYSMVMQDSSYEQRQAIDFLDKLCAVIVFLCQVLEMLI